MSLKKPSPIVEHLQALGSRMVQTDMGKREINSSELYKIEMLCGRNIFPRGVMDEKKGIHRFISQLIGIKMKSTESEPHKGIDSKRFETHGKEISGHSF